MVGQDFTDHASGELGVLRVVVQRGDENFHGLPDRPAASPGPGRPVHGQPFLEDPAALAGQERPGDRGVAGWIADAARAEIDDGGQPSVLSQQVAGLRIAMEPDRAAWPGGLDRGLPDLGGLRSPMWLSSRNEFPRRTL